MCAEETKDKGKKSEFGGCGCPPENFQEFFKKFGEQFAGEGGFADCSALMKVCCGLAKKDTKTDCS
jgi:hypothetical protein